MALNQQANASPKRFIDACQQYHHDQVSGHMKQEESYLLTSYYHADCWYSVSGMHTLWKFMKERNDRTLIDSMERGDIYTVQALILKLYPEMPIDVVEVPLYFAISHMRYDDELVREMFSWYKSHDLIVDMDVWTRRLKAYRPEIDIQHI